MILPITSYGMPILRHKTEPITQDYPNLADLIANMYETMYNANGVGLAAPQINLSIRVFITDGEPMAEKKDPNDILRSFKKVFINPIILEEKGTKWEYEEGCLSIPGIRENVSRHPEVLLKYHDENFELHEEWFDGMRARIIQHEYDHLEGKLFTDYCSTFRKQLLKSKLNRISRGEMETDYKMIIK